MRSNQEIGRVIATRRMERGVGLMSFARKVGIDYDVMAKIESGEREISGFELRSIADALCTTPGTLE